MSAFGLWLCLFHLHSDEVFKGEVLKLLTKPSTSTSSQHRILVILGV